MTRLVGISMAILAASMAVSGPDALCAYMDAEPRRKSKLPSPHKQTEPVIDSSRESKRAKRRRMARSRKEEGVVA